ncbi:hypothetical protein CCR94_18190 [Rhodoblastus sphagnicola]|uniref:Uncharacterized protein n=1 Tax=Rhodoblastus sphagnicola TaxID=333368 RepID=A0A2S6N0V7_9HYPH|nr:hypothetical protein [Rhodoblastus sphagnicola]MBB4200585.1 hypothetical protein [Rhodoblastus sphagnicola]PPQ28229.1 hypothetical protein CCR94_18190 [Rhodoblastus sphagnicola]
MIRPCDVLVLISCSGVKTGGGKKPLIDLYAGPMWLINEQSGFLCHGPNYEEVFTQAVSVRAVPRSTPRED